MKISIIGSGWVGTAVGCGFMRLGHEVLFHDIVYKDNLPNYTASLAEAVTNSQLSFICVPTPTVDGKIDLRHVKDVVRKMGKALATLNRHHIVVLKSTVTPGTTESVVIPLLKRYAMHNNFDVVYNPEFLTQISNTWSQTDKRDFFSEDRVVIGAIDNIASEEVALLYDELKVPIVRTDIKTAEFIKYAANCMLATKVSFWNELFLLATQLGVDMTAITRSCALDSRIGSYGTVYGKAFGGTCLPKDLKAFIAFAAPYRKLKLLQAVNDVNSEMADLFGVRE